MLSTPTSIISSKNLRTLLGSAPSNSVVLVVTRKPASTAARMPSRAMSYPPSRQTEKSWCSLLTVDVNGEAQVLAGLEEVQLFFQQQGVGAEINIFLARDQAFDNFVDLGMHQRLAAGDGDHGGAAFIHGFEAVFRGKIGFQDVGGILDLAASGAGQIAAEQRLEHEHERIALASGQFLAQDIGSHRPHLGYRNCHHPSGKNVFL